MSTWTDFHPGSRPVAVLGGGVLGRRIAATWAAGGYNVVIRDPVEAARNQAIHYIDQNLAAFSELTGGSKKLGSYTAVSDLESAVKDAFLVVEAVPEILDLKLDTMAQVAKITKSDCIIGSNSSSYKSRELVDKVDSTQRKRICNIHYTMPPGIRTVELMTDGETEPSIFEFLMDVHKEIGLVPVTARKESTGFIFNRLWAAIKRECLMIMAEGSSDAEQIDTLWEQMFRSNPLGPCGLMDQVGLDTVVSIEDHYIKERRLDSTNTVDWLKRNYIDQGKLGAKSGKGGFYPAGHSVTQYDGKVDHSTAPTIYALDVGMGGNVPLDHLEHAGRVIAISASGETVRDIVTDLPMPDGIQISVATNQIFWTNMGIPSENDGCVMSANLDGSDVKTIIASGQVHTPKQLVLDENGRKVYFCDREGQRVHRCNFDGSQHEILVQTADWRTTTTSDPTLWCVGITVDTKNGHLYWTQKGASKANQGRIFRAGLHLPDGETADTRSDIECLFDHLPEPIDLEIIPETQMLYWTDRGELPFGNSLNRAYVGNDVSVSKKPQILARHLNEAIGLRIDGVNQHVYVADMGGRVYRFNMDGTGRKVIYSCDGAFTGIDLDFVNH